MTTQPTITTKENDVASLPTVNDATEIEAAEHERQARASVFTMKRPSILRRVLNRFVQLSCEVHADVIARSDTTTMWAMSGYGVKMLLGAAFSGCSVGMAASIALGNSAGYVFGAGAATMYWLLDRAMFSQSVGSTPSIWKVLTRAGATAIISLAAGMFANLIIYEKDIAFKLTAETEAAIDAVTSRTNTARNAFMQFRAAEEAKLAPLRTSLAQAEAAVIGEKEGTSGSGKPGAGPASREKAAARDRATEDLRKAEVAMAEALKVSPAAVAYREAESEGSRKYGVQKSLDRDGLVARFRVLSEIRKDLTMEMGLTALAIVMFELLAAISISTRSRSRIDATAEGLNAYHAEIERVHTLVRTNELWKHYGQSAEELAHTASLQRRAQAHALELQEMAHQAALAKLEADREAEELRRATLIAQVRAQQAAHERATTSSARDLADSEG